MARIRVLLSIGALGIALTLIGVRQVQLIQYDIQHEKMLAVQVQSALTVCHDGNSAPASRDAQIYAAILRTRGMRTNGTFYLVEHIGEGQHRTTDPGAPLIPEETQCEVLALLADLNWDLQWMSTNEEAFTAWDARTPPKGVNQIVVFDDMEMRADGTVYLLVDYICPMCGDGLWYLLKEVDGTWIVTGSGQVWLN
jgi:hypothetical protein